MDWIRLTCQEVDEDVLPPVCVYCGAAAATRLDRTFSWRPRWVTWLYLAGVLPGAIVASVLARQMRVSLPVCVRHYRRPRLHVFVLAVGWLLFPLLLAGIAAGVVAFVLRTPDLNERELEDLRRQWVQMEREVKALEKPADSPDRNRIMKEDDEGQRRTDEEKRYKDKKAEFRQLSLRVYEVERTVKEQRRLTEEVQRSRPAAFRFAVGSAAGLGLLLWLLEVYLLTDRRRLIVQEITPEGITLIGVADPFVRAVRDQRATHAPGPTGPDEPHRSAPLPPEPRP